MTTAHVCEINVETAPGQPRDGDIIVSEDATSPGYYAIEHVPGMPHVSCVPIGTRRVAVLARIGQHDATGRDFDLADRRQARSQLEESDSQVV